MKKLLIAAFLFVASPAFAGSITVTIINDAGATVGTKAYSISTAHILRIIAVMKARYGQVPSGPADPVTGVVPMRDRTNAEAALAWIGGFMQGTIDAVKQDEGNTAGTAARDAVAPITAN